MQTTFKLFVSCLFCLLLTLLSGCGGGGTGGGMFTESAPKFTPAEQAEVDKYVANYGRDAIVHYLEKAQERDDNEELILKYVKYFVLQGADVNARDGNAMTPLFYANHVSVAQLLVSKGADVKAKNVAKETPLSLRKSMGYRLQERLGHRKANPAMVEYLESVDAKPH
jgi:hypothetical protein